MVSKYPTDSWSASFEQVASATYDSVRSWWFRRRATRLLAARMRDFEDFEVRFTDSLLEYSTLGDMIAAFPPAAVEKKIALTRAADDRSVAIPYYLTYLGESQLAYGRYGAATESLREAASGLRADIDVGLSNQVRALLLRTEVPGSEGYRSAAISLYHQNPAWLKNAGLTLPVSVRTLDNSAQRQIEAGGFNIDPESPITITGFPDGSVQMTDPTSSAARILTAKNSIELSTKAFRIEEQQ